MLLFVILLILLLSSIAFCLIWLHDYLECWEKCPGCGQNNSPRECRGDSITYRCCQCANVFVGPTYSQRKKKIKSALSVRIFK